MSDASIRPARPEDFAAFYPSMIDTRVLVVDGAVLAIGLLTRNDGRLWLTIDTKPGAGMHALGIVRAARELMGRQEEPVFAPCQEASFPSAPRLLRAIGFVETDEVFKNIMKVWVWRKSDSY